MKIFSILTVGTALIQSSVAAAPNLDDCTLDARLQLKTEHIDPLMVQEFWKRKGGGGGGGRGSLSGSGRGSSK